MNRLFDFYGTWKVEYQSIESRMMTEIRVVAPARWITEATAERFAGICRAYGHRTTFDPQCFSRYGQLAGPDEERANAFVDALQDAVSPVVWCARGGYGSGRLLDLLSLDTNLTKGKILIGYSDITSLLISEGFRGIIRIHGGMPFDIENSQKIDNVELILRELEDLTSAFSQGRIAVRPIMRGEASGPVIVANLSVLTRLIGTPYMPSLRGCILVIEDVSEYLYAIDRMFLHLKLSGSLSLISGLCLGDFTDIQDNEVSWGCEIEEIARHFTSSLGIPVAFAAPIGHGPRNCPIQEFANATLSVFPSESWLSWSAPDPQRTCV